MTFADLNLPIAAGYGVWTATEVATDSWSAAEDRLATAAAEWLTGEDGNAPNGMSVFRNEAEQRLTLDLIRRAS